MKIKFLSTFPFFRQERAQKFYSVILTLLALSFFGFFVINPTVSTILKLQKEISDNESINNQLETKIINLNKLATQYTNLQNDLPIITDAITKEPDAHLLLAQIQTVARESNIKMQRLQSLEVDILSISKPQENKYHSYSFVIAGSSTFENISSFISAITNMQRVVDIDVFAMNYANEKDSQSLDFNIQGAAFFKE